MTNEQAYVRFWGVRGSLPSPGQETAVVGGNTPCVEIVGGDTRLVLDAGSGLRALGDARMAEGRFRRTDLLLSHVHWDHVMGLPFYTPIYVPGSEVHIASGPLGAPLRELLHRQMSAPMFPVDLEAIGSTLTTRELDPSAVHAFGELSVRLLRVAHPDPCFAFRIEHRGRVVVYATDVEHETVPAAELVAFVRDADLLIYDAQFTPDEYEGRTGPSRRGWGHSTYEAGASLARAADVRTLALFHHDPRRTDEGVAELSRLARALFPATIVAREGLSVSLRSPFEADAA
jgi:phosphoribosyl 1,2-cyclic phosphodiesterase